MKLTTKIAGRSEDTTGASSLVIKEDGNIITMHINNKIILTAPKDYKFIVIVEK